MKAKLKAAVIPVTKGEDDELTAVAKAILRPEVQASLTLQRFCPLTEEELELPALIGALSDQTRMATQEGDLRRLEAMLVAQAHSLDAVFNSLARRAAVNMGEYVNAADTYMRLALRAQSQCRATIEALAEIKNPTPIAFVRQANIAHGPQQVNNTEAPRAGECQKTPNELLEVTSEKGMDPRAPNPASRMHSTLASMGQGDGPP